MGIEDIAFSSLKSWWSNKKNRERTVKLIIKELEHNNKLMKDTMQLSDNYVASDKRPDIVFFPFQIRISDSLIRTGIVFLINLGEEEINQFIELNNLLSQINELIKGSNSGIKIAVSPVEPDNRPGTFMPLLIRNQCGVAIGKIINLETTFTELKI